MRPPVGGRAPPSRQNSHANSPAGSTQARRRCAAPCSASPHPPLASLPPHIRYHADMAQIESLFVTRIYRAHLNDFGPGVDPPDEVEANCWGGIAEDDEAGQQWCEDNGYPGYTSYASLTDLTWRSPVFADIKTALDAHVAEFAKDLEFNLDGRELVLEDLWINILPPGGYHSAHIHPHSVISGTTYVSMPDGASALRYETRATPA